jgi:hypothetical protein
MHLTYANESKRVVRAPATVKMWMYKNVNDIQSWLLGAGWKQEERYATDPIRVMQQMREKELQKESKEEL